MRSSPPFASRTCFFSAAAVAMARPGCSSLPEPPLPRPRVPSVVPGAPVRGGRRFRHTPSQARSAKKGLAGRLTAASVGSSGCGPPRASRAPCLCATVSPHRCVSGVCHSTGVSAANPQSLRRRWCAIRLTDHPQTLALVCRQTLGRPLQRRAPWNVQLGRARVGCGGARLSSASACLSG